MKYFPVTKFSFKAVSVLLIMFLSHVLSAGASASFVPDSIKPEFRAVKIDGNLKISGKLDDPQWLKAIPIELNYEIQPGENTPSRQRTIAMALYDAENLYIGFRCFDSVPANIRANLSDRDKIFTDDYVLVTIDPYNNYQRGFEFAVNPFGIQGDLLAMGGDNEDPSYDMVWQSAASRDNQGWTAEMVIPFRTLVFSQEQIQSWTIGLFRNMPRNNRYQISWTPIDRNVPSFLSQGGLLTGLDGIKSGKALEILPYIMAQQSGARSDISDPLSAMNNGKVTARIGGGIQYSPGPNISINAVVNPDFSQIESDADQLSVNTTFALYYPEKRPFFMAGMDLVQTPMYYSRTINNPIFASKINGKAGKFSYLALTAWDRNTAITVPGEEESNTVESNKESFAAVGRLRYDLGDESFVGVLLLSRNLNDAHNYINGLDWNFKFWKNWYWQGEVFLSATREVNDTLLFNSDRQFGSTGHDAGFNGENYLGTGMHLTLARQGRNYSFSVTQNNFSPTYQTYNGMFPEVGERSSYMTHRYTVQPNWKILQKASVSMTAMLINNYEGLMKDFTLRPGFTLNLIGQTRVQVSYAPLSRQRFRNVFFPHASSTQFSIETIPVKGVNIGIQGEFGKSIFRSESPELGKGYNLTSSIGLEPFSRLKTEFTWTYAKLDDYDTDNNFYKGNIIRNITTFQFSKFLFLRNIVQYNTFSSNFSVYPLLNYKFNAFTMFCVGATRDLLDYNTNNYQFRTSGYQYFVKLQYLFQ
ncbi:MAG TPA: carbohydrate binding family 9 domain-containing protein [Bacteroidales bacterium]|nr:carbohydrate binding family 9 domain-containing protein [Bacteroidales bacterium]